MAVTEVLGDPDLEVVGGVAVDGADLEVAGTDVVETPPAHRGRVHTQAYLRLTHHFPQLGVRPELVAVADEVPGRAQEAAAQFGFAAATTDWRALDPLTIMVMAGLSCSANSSPLQSSFASSS